MIPHDSPCGASHNHLRPLQHAFTWGNLQTNGPKTTKITLLNKLLRDMNFSYKISIGYRFYYYKPQTDER